MKIHPVIMAGGSGTRLWPLSRQAYPKQFLPLLDTMQTLLQQTMQRVAEGDLFTAPLLLCHDDYRFIVAEQFRQMGIEPEAIILEPVSRNTAPAAALAALQVMANDPDGLMLILPSDHAVSKPDAFIEAVRCAAEFARKDYLVTFGITPDRPETGYGYIERGEPLGDGVEKVRRFVEKPALEKAQEYLATGRYVWNGGIFLMPVRGLIAELKKFAPEVVAAAEKALAGKRDDLNFVRLDRDAFAAAPSISIDYAVMEKTDRAAVVPVDMGWSDIGAWDAIWDITAKDERGNVMIGDVVARETDNCLIRSEERLVAASGVSDLIIISTDNATLVVPKSQAQDVKKLYDLLKSKKRVEAEFHATVHRPWGSFRGLSEGDHFQVKKIIVKPGASLSLQYHHHRAEHWVVVEGTAKVTNGDKTFLLEKNQSTFIPIGVMHRLENPSPVKDLAIIEVQSGDYLGEDDIVRIQDSYGRTG